MLKHLHNQIILSNNNTTGNIFIADFKLLYQSILVKTIVLAQKNRHIYEWNRIEEPFINQFY